MIDEMRPPNCASWCSREHDGWDEDPNELVMRCAHVIPLDCGDLELWLERYAWGTGVDDATVRLSGDAALTPKLAQTLAIALARAGELLSKPARAAVA